MRRLHVRRVPGARVRRRQVEHDADLTRVVSGAVSLNGLRVGQHGVIRHGGCPTKIHHVRVVEVVQITAFHRNNRLIEGKPVQHAVAEQLEANLRIAGVRVHHVTVFPAANLLHRHRHVEMEQGEKRRDALFIQLINDLVVKIDRVRVHFTDTVRDQARPANRGTKAVVVQLL